MRAHIQTKQAKFTLERLHAELAGKILDNRQEADRLRTAMQHVEAVLKLLDPNHNLRTIAVRRRAPNGWFRRGTIYRTALDTLRKGEIAERMMQARGITDAPRSSVERLEGAIRASLVKNSEVIGEGSPVTWRVV